MINMDYKTQDEIEVLKFVNSSKKETWKDVPIRNYSEIEKKFGVKRTDKAVQALFIQGALFEPKAGQIASLTKNEDMRLARKKVNMMM